MKVRSGNRRALLGVVVGLLIGALSLWLIGGDAARRMDALKEQALCVLEIPRAAASTSAAFTIPERLKGFTWG